MLIVQRFLLILSLLMTPLVLAQTHPCGTIDYLEQRISEDPSIVLLRENYEQEIQSIINSKNYFSQKIIPVVVHIIYNDSYSNISNSQVYSAITAINQDFNGTNPDFYQVVSAFSSVKSDVEITFALAQLDPDGNPTNGITRTNSNQTDNAGENVKSLVQWDTDMYLNVWVVDNIESGAGAYAYFPGTAPSGAEGIVCRHDQFGTNGTSSSSDFAATTLTHEIGHYLNLSHTWGDSNEPELDSNCNIDDNVSDTPNTKGTSYSCNTSQWTCGSLDNVQNYMDYTNCSKMFTEGQRSRMHAALHSAQGGRVNLWQYENLLATGILDESECDVETVSVQIHTGSYANEVSWVILDADGEGVAGGGGTYNNNSNYYTSVCLQPGSYTFESMDSYGDGWNGGYYYVRDCDNSVIAYMNNPSGNGASEPFTVTVCNPPILGCTDASASNFDTTANEDDGSCIYLGCTDAMADNYDSVANEDDGSCEYWGCMDVEALNYDVQANVEDNSCEYLFIPEEFNYTLTGSNHTIVVPGDITINLLEGPIAVNDIIGVFYEDDNGDLQCAGYTVWQGSTNSIAAQGDDSTTDETDGFVSGEAFKWLIWDTSEMMMLVGDANYSSAMPNQGSYTGNGISALAGLHALPPVSDQEIILPEGWSMFSTYMLTEDMDLATVLSPIYADLMIVKDYAGMAYLPEWNYNGIGDLQNTQGYQIKMSQAQTLTVSGQYQLPEDNPLYLLEGWNMISYLRLEASDCMAVFESISAEVILAKDYLGNAFLPAWGFNGIGNLEPGKGYQVKLNSDQILTYLSNDQEYRFISSEVKSNQTIHYPQAKNTGNNMTLGIFDEAWEILPSIGDEIIAYDAIGTVVASGLYNSPVTMLTLWGDELESAHKDGLLIGEKAQFMLWDSSLDKEYLLEFNNWIEESEGYTVDALAQVGTVSIVDLDNTSIEYTVLPNPAKDNFTLNIQSTNTSSLNLTLYNALGQIEIQNELDIQKGIKSYNFDLLKLPEGLYYLEMQSDFGYHTERLIIIK